jgi:hypothetical protein
LLAAVFLAVLPLSAATAGAQGHDPSRHRAAGSGESLAPGEPEKAACEWICSNQRSSRYSGCNASFSLCVGSAVSARSSCLTSCGGAPACENNCHNNYFAAVAFCTAQLNSCTAVADELYSQCLDLCGDGGPCGAADRTATVALSLEDTALGQKLDPAPVAFSLARAENRGAEIFILDEWAIVQDGGVKSSSDSAFAWAVTDQDAAPALGPVLLIQEPIHEMNSRHVPKPEVRIASTRLAPSERGEGEIVAARLEFSSANLVDRVEILYSSAPRPMEKSRLENLVSRRVGLVFASEKAHRTAVYVVFRLTHRFELLGTFTAFPKCCCGGQFCA